jgi:hypothetical protein
MKHSIETLDKAIATVLPHVKEIFEKGGNMGVVTQILQSSRNELMHKAIVRQFLHPEEYTTRKEKGAFIIIREHLLDFEERYQ